jgi:rubrerythrin
MRTLMGIDFAQLSLDDALDLAVLVEEEARERYDDFADFLERRYTPEAALFFRFMARNEERHRKELVDKRRARFGILPSRLTRAAVFEIEAPAYDEMTAFMTPREALHVVLRAERHAYHFYSEALAHLRDPAVTALFRELRDEEVEHQRLVLAELEKLPPESASHPRCGIDGARRLA